MTTSTAHAGSREHYFVPQPSFYPAILSGGMFLLALGFIQTINSFPHGKWVMLGGVGVILYVLFGWFGRVISESQGGSYRDWEDLSFRYGKCLDRATAYFLATRSLGPSCTSRRKERAGSPPSVGIEIRRASSLRMAATSYAFPMPTIAN